MTISVGEDVGGGDVFIFPLSAIFIFFLAVKAIFILKTFIFCFY